MLLLEQVFTARGANVRKMTNLAGNELENVIPAFLDSIKQPAYTLWISYSGHAVQINGRNYLQGIDSDFSSVSRVRGFGVDLDRIIAQVERAKPVAAVVSLDACRNNPFEPELTRGEPQGLAATDPRGYCVSFSTAPYMRALNGEANQNSPYARALADALAGKQSKSLDVVLRETANAVYRNTNQRQVPEYRSALRGEWWFEAGSDSLAVTVRDVEMTSPTIVGSAPSSTSARAPVTREVSYRPDEPPPPVRYVQMDAAYWAQLDQRITLASRRMGSDQARELLRAVEKKSAPEEQRLLASVLLQDGLAGTKPDPRKARRLLQASANEGNAYAQTLMGESFFNEKLFADAYKWLSLAARTGYSRATTNLSQMEALGMVGSDPLAGAFRTIESMGKQMRENFPKPGQQPSPEAMDAAKRIQDMFNAPKR